MGPYHPDLPPLGPLYWPDKDSSLYGTRSNMPSPKVINDSSNLPLKTQDPLLDANRKPPVETLGERNQDKQ